MLFGASRHAARMRSNDRGFRMSILRTPGLGPIIGHTTHRSCRLWIQAQDLENAGADFASNRRTVGVIGVVTGRGASRRIDGAWYFRLHREFDRTGTFVLGEDVGLGRHRTDHERGDIRCDRVETATPLQPDTQYTVRLATLSIDDPLPDAESITDTQLAGLLPPIEGIRNGLLDLDAEDCEVTFRTFPDPAQPAPSLAFMLGSCRYPGLLFQVKQADRIFGPLRRHLAEEARERPGSLPAARFTLMVGDQIYADKLNRHVPIGRADTYAEFQERYKTALGSPNMRALLRTAPTYMILDDHEIEDNWTQDRVRASANLFNIAIGAYMSYQWSHGPRSFGRLLYYKFDCAGYPFFVLDTRTQRYKDATDDLSDNHLLGRPQIDPRHQGQLQVFLDWLSEQQNTRGNVPKFVGTSSVFAPNAMDERITDPRATEADLFRNNLEKRNESDSWPAFPSTRRAIVEHIVRNRIQNVIFLSGDIHCSNIAEIEFETGTPRSKSDLRAYDITSSAFYWPFPFADGDPNNYVHDSRHAASGQTDPFPFADGVMHYNAWAFTQEDNFCRIDIDRNAHALTVRYYNRDGRQIQLADRQGRLVMEDVLPLAAWT